MKSWKNNCKMKENISYIHHISGGASNREPTCKCRKCKRHGFDPWVRNIPWMRKWQSTLVFLPGEPHRQRSLKGYSLWGCKRVGHDWSNLAWCTYIIDSSGMNCVITKWIWKNIILFCSCLWVSIFEQKKKKKFKTFQVRITWLLPVSFILCISVCLGDSLSLRVSPLLLRV